MNSSERPLLADSGPSNVDYVLGNIKSLDRKHFSVHVKFGNYRCRLSNRLLDGDFRY